MTVTAAPLSASPSSVLENEKASSEKPLSTTSQLFTDVLTEATSKVLRDVLDKPAAFSNLNQKAESAKAVPLKSAKEEHSEPSSKKSAAIDVATQMVPVVVAPIPLPINETAQHGEFTLAHIAKVPTTKQIEVSPIAEYEVHDSKSLPMKIDARQHSSSVNFESKEFVLIGLTPSSSTRQVINEDPRQIVHVDPDSKVIGPVERDRVETAKPFEPSENSSSLTTKSTNSVAKLVFAPEIHISTPIATGSAQGVRAVRTSEPSIRASAEAVTTKNEHIPSIPIRSESDVVTVWPTHPSVVVSGIDAMPSPSRTVQPSPHSLDVGGLANAISRPLDEARGGYTVTIAMHPLELGHLQAVVTLHGADLHVSIAAQTQVGHEALINVVETLKTELSRGGVNVNLTLQDPGSQPRGDDRPPGGAVPREVFSQEESVATASAAPVPSANAINLIL